MQPGKAVFLSYASEDADAAARICASLRDAGIEVWFDQSELRGGDAWDLQIRRQIRDCALFIAVVSSHTQQRAEGYFRLEWTLADQRSQMIARSRAFIVPVCIDGTKEADAEVPDSFLQAHWIRLPGGSGQAEFCARIKLLLEGKNAPAQSADTTGPRMPAAQSPQRSRKLELLGLGVVLLIGVCWLSWRALAPGNVGRPVAAPSTRAEVTAAVVPERSIAVLPFVNMSSDTDQDYFADGLTEELIDHLGRIPDLKVIARTSSFAFKGKNEDVRTIAGKLGVANLLEGSVRKSGAELRITAQLIRAADGIRLWSDTFERKLSDIFRIQDEISTTIAKALNVAMDARSAPAVDRPANIEAYNLVLRGNYFYFRHNPADAERALASFQEAVKLDPTYALAWVGLSNAYSDRANLGVIDEATGYAQARVAAERAVSIAPDSARAHVNMGWVHATMDWDWTSARDEFERARTLDPKERSAARGLAFVNDTIYGRLAPQIALRREELALNPLDIHQLAQLAYDLLSTSQLEESAATFRNLLQLNPDAFGAHGGLATTLLFLGRLQEAESAADMESDEFIRTIALASIYWVQHRKLESDALLSQAETRHGADAPYQLAGLHAYRGENDAAFEWLDRAYRAHDSNVVTVRSDPLLRTLHGDPRYRALLEKMKLNEPPRSAGTSRSIQAAGLANGRGVARIQLGHAPDGTRDGDLGVKAGNMVSADSSGSFNARPATSAIQVW
jgi:TolB-like protein